MHPDARVRDESKQQYWAWGAAVPKTVHYLTRASGCAVKNIGGELQKRLCVSGGEHHLLDMVGTEENIFMREAGPTLVTTANVCCLSIILKCHYLVVSVAKYS